MHERFRVGEVRSDRREFAGAQKRMRNAKLAGLRWNFLLKGSVDLGIIILMEFSKLEIYWEAIQWLTRWE